MNRIGVSIIGLGLIGGSLGMALRSRASDKIRVTGYARNPATAKLAQTMGAVELVARTPEEAVAGADYVFLCTPVLTILKLAAQVAPHMKSESVLTDVGSTKRWLGEQIRRLLPSDIHFVGAHPMAGKERSGIEAATPDLFQNRWFLLTPDAAVPVAAVDRLEELVRLTGARTAIMDEATHDRRTAVISHVPHVVAAAMVHLLDKEEDPMETGRFVGGGFRDTTRIASSDADMWADICITNAAPILDCLQDMSRILEDISRKIAAGERDSIHTFFATAKRRRDALLKQETTAPD